MPSQNETENYFSVMKFLNIFVFTTKKKKENEEKCVSCIQYGFEIYFNKLAGAKLIQLRMKLTNQENEKRKKSYEYRRKRRQ